MAEPVIPTDSKVALYTVCLFLAQSGEPHTELGYKTQTAAFDEIGTKFGVPKNSVRNVRDMFDRFTDSDRVGWENAELPLRFKTILDQHADTGREELRDISLEIMSSEWEKLGKEDDQKMKDGGELSETARFSQEVAANFLIPKFTIIAESYATTWGFVNGAGRTFKLSNDDLKRALTEILAAWGDWTAADLNNNSKNPDDTLTSFAGKHFSSGAHQVLANDQRRGFLHFISAIAFTATHDIPFDEAASKLPLKKEDYEAALGLVSEIQRNSKIVSQGTSTSDVIKKQQPALKGGENVIFYGAPGTGKSNRVEKKINEAGKRPFRTVFHPDLQNSDFFGCLKPQMDGKKVRYGFSPGPFMKALAGAYREPAEPVFLVIEELNRAAAAAVFGDLFLLLDRDDDGKGEYDVSFPSPESEQWFEAETGRANEALLLPSNLYIYATMNSADQGVYPIDTAFRRRWRQEYLPLDYKSGPDGDVAYVDSTGKRHSLAWREFVKLLNGHLTSSQTLDIAEDRLLGQWFVKKKELDGKGIPEKVLLYLWDDLLRHEGRDLIFDTSSIKTYGNLTTEIAREGRILSDRFLAALNAASDVDTTEPEETVEDES
ncbi:AAA family ATPase [Pseudosulfitobacter sp. SM2401]|uniref:AAA family ATPase n=1 Tax=Pseudosulfitobacter sp. SM2401 TaxID=3350098 RepID=UPI0036F22E63